MQLSFIQCVKCAVVVGSSLLTLVGTQMPTGVFNRIASFPVNANLPADMAQTTETSSEVITATEDGMMLVYSDSPLDAVGLTDISDAGTPVPEEVG